MAGFWHEVFTMLARFRLEIEPSRDRMVWTRLNHAPADPPVPRRDGEQPAELAVGPRPAEAAPPHRRRRRQGGVRGHALGP